VTDVVAGSASDRSWSFEPAGERTMKGLTEPVRLFRVESAARP